MPASRSSPTSCQRLAWREPAALVWASSSIRISVGRRTRAPSRSSSRSVDPRYSTVRLGRTSRPWSNASVSTRSCVSTKPTTTSTPSSRCSRAASSMAYVLPTPAAAPKNTFSLPRRRRASSSWTRARSASGSGRTWLTGASVALATSRASLSRNDEGRRRASHVRASHDRDQGTVGDHGKYVQSKSEHQRSRRLERSGRIDGNAGRHHEVSHGGAKRPAVIAREDVDLAKEGSPPRRFVDRVHQWPALGEDTGESTARLHDRQFVELVLDHESPGFEDRIIDLQRHDVLAHDVANPGHRLLASLPVFEVEARPVEPSPHQHESECSNHDGAFEDRPQGPGRDRDLDEGNQARLEQSDHIQ